MVLDADRAYKTLHSNSKSSDTCFSAFAERWVGLCVFGGRLYILGGFVSGFVISGHRWVGGLG